MANVLTEEKKQQVLALSMLAEARSRALINPRSPINEMSLSVFETLGDMTDTCVPVLFVGRYPGGTRTESNHRSAHAPCMHRGVLSRNVGRFGCTFIARCIFGCIKRSRPRGFALDPSVDISQYAHTSWTVRDGFFKVNVFSIAQTPVFVHLIVELLILRSWAVGFPPDCARVWARMPNACPCVRPIET